MQRSIVIRHECHTQVNINDEIGLEPYSSYTVAEYLEDQAVEDARTVMAQVGCMYVFSDGVTEILEQRSQRIDVERMDARTQAAVLESAALRSMPQWGVAAVSLPVC